MPRWQLVDSAFVLRPPVRAAGDVIVRAPPWRLPSFTDRGYGSLLYEQGRALIQGLVNGVQSALSGAGATIAGAIRDAVPGGGAIADLAGRIPRPFATGGIVRSPTLALLGEAGPEAVIPLSGPHAPGMQPTVVNTNHYEIHVDAAGGDPDRIAEVLLPAIRELERRGSVTVGVTS